MLPVLLLLAMGIFALFAKIVFVFAQKRSGKINTYLRAQDTLCRLLTEENSIDHITTRVLQTVGEACDWPIGEFWAPDENDSVLKRVAQWHDPSKAPQTQTLGKNAFNITSTVNEHQQTLGVLYFLNKSARSPEKDEMNLLTLANRVLAQSLYRSQKTQKNQTHEKLLNSLIEYCPFIILIKDAKTLRYVYANKAGEAFLGFDSSRIIGKTDAEILPLEQAQFYTRLDQDLLHDKKILDIPEDPIKTALGDLVFHTRKIPIIDQEGKPLYLLCLFEDVTEHKKTQDMLFQARDVVVNAEHFKAQFMVNVSHEIRTPMNAIIGMTQILGNTPLNPEQKEAVGIIHNAGETLLQVINQILDFSSLEAGKLKLEKIALDLREVFENVMDTLAHQAQAKGLELTCFIPDQLTTYLEGDAIRLTQILINLVGNALKFTEHGEVVVRTEQLSHEGEWVRFRTTVQDTGIGMSLDERSHIFQAFAQVGMPDRHRGHGGAGLGLALSKKFVEMMGGEIGVTSEPEKGSTFWFTYQLKHHPSRTQPAPISTDSLKGVRALIIDDNDTNRKILHYQLSSWAMSAENAASGPAALELLKTAAREGRPYQVALVDMWMPDMDGLTLTRAIKQDPLLNSVKIVIMTSLAQRPDDKELQEAGVNLFLVKPVRQNQLLQCLKTICSLSTSAHIQHSSSRNNRSLHTTRILLAEDNRTNQQVALLLLKKLGYTADTAVNGIEALKAVSVEDYDVIFMDCQMPHLDGYATTAEIRRREAAGPRTPIIAMTANAIEGDRQKCFNAGMDDYISKPISLERLAVAMTKWTAPIDPSVLSKFREEDAGRLLNSIIEEYLSDAPAHLKILRDAALREDAEAVRRESHLLKGASGNFNARKLVRLCARLEALSKNGWMTGIPKLVRAIEDEFANVRTALEAEREAA